MPLQNFIELVPYLALLPLYDIVRGYFALEEVLQELLETKLKARDIEVDDVVGIYGK